MTTSSKAKRSRIFSRFIVTGTSGNGCFYWGAGSRTYEAETNFRRAGGTKIGGRNVFTSSIKFAPIDRDAKETEADCYVTPDGSICWIRCERKVVEKW